MRKATTDLLLMMAMPYIAMLFILFIMVVS